MRVLRSLFVPLVLGIALLGIAMMTRTSFLAREDPGLPINSAMRQALGQMTLDPADAERVATRYPDAVVTSPGLRYMIDQPGSGSRSPVRGQFVSIHFRESLLDGTLIEDSALRGDGPFNFPVGQGRVPAAWDESVKAMTKGEKRTVIVPYWLGYGEKGQRGRVPAKATVVLELELIELH